MSKKLVIVESPHKSKTIEKYLGKGSNLNLLPFCINNKHIITKNIKHDN